MIFSLLDEQTLALVVEVPSPLSHLTCTMMTKMTTHTGAKLDISTCSVDDRSDFEIATVEDLLLVLIITESATAYQKE